MTPYSEAPNCVNCGLVWTTRMLYPGSFPLLACAVVGWSSLTGRKEVCKEIIWKTNVYEFRRKVNNAAGYAACDTTNAQGGAVCLDAVCLDGKQGISTAWEILDCSDLVTALWRAGQASMAKRGGTFMNKTHCYIVSICLFCSKDSKGPVKAIAKSCSVAVLSLP